MVKLIDDLLWDAWHQDKGDVDTEYTATRLLTLLENKGMLPPWGKISKDNYGNEWEPEENE